tara:strand:- start:1781 stop:2245 length:465 start_codon:yes stop_codon:yes gene_type:complete
MFNIFKNHIVLQIIILIFLSNCQLKEPSNNHGILFLKNRYSQLDINKHNKNDVIKLLGLPHSKSIDNDDNWIYIERVFVKGDFHKLGQNVLKTNNVLYLSFDKYGVLNNKELYDKEKINNLKFSKKSTVNDLAKTSFIESFLSSIKTKMYSNRK